MTWKLPQLVVGLQPLSTNQDQPRNIASDKRRASYFQLLKKNIFVLKIQYYFLVDIEIKSGTHQQMLKRCAKFHMCSTNVAWNQTSVTSSFCHALQLGRQYLALWCCCSSSSSHAAGICCLHHHPRPESKECEKACLLENVQAAVLPRADLLSCAAHLVSSFSWPHVSQRYGRTSLAFCGPSPPIQTQKLSNRLDKAYRYPSGVLWGLCVKHYAGYGTGNLKL